MWCTVASHIHMCHIQNVKGFLVSNFESVVFDNSPKFGMQIKLRFFGNFWRGLTKCFCPANFIKFHKNLLSILARYEPLIYTKCIKNPTR